MISYVKSFTVSPLNVLRLLSCGSCGIRSVGVVYKRQFSGKSICYRPLLKYRLSNINRYRYNSTESCFSLKDYDCVGFDLDNTITEYNLDNTVRHEYSVLAEYLVKELGYSENVLLTPLSLSDVDFVQKGLIIDIDRSNLLRIRDDGYIFKAAHGFKILNDEEIMKCYGVERRWCVTTDFAQNPVAAWYGPLSEKLRTLADYFDMPAAIALSRCINSKVSSGKEINCSNIWKDVLSGLIYMYDRTCFSLSRGYFTTQFKSNPEHYFKKCRPIVLDFLQELKKHKVTFLITGSNVDHAFHTASYCIGENWRDYFDIVICYSRKPGFFVGNRSFVELNGFDEIGPISNDKIKIGNIYSQGNWQGLHDLLAVVTKKIKPRCLYIGDNLIQDIFTVSEYTNCDTVAVAEELSAEYFNHSHKDILLSKAWGSYFTNGNFNSLWGGIIRNHSKICIPNLDVLASKPFDYKFTSFSNKSSGFHLLHTPVDLGMLTDNKKRNLIR